MKLRKPTEENIRKYKIISSTSLKGKKYFKTYLKKNFKKSQRCWSMLNYAIGKMNDKSSLLDSFIMNNQTYTDTAEIAEGFNNLFSKIGLHTSHNVPPYKQHFSSYMSPPVQQTFFLGQVTPSDVSTSAKNLKPKASSGFDHIYTKLMKDTIDFIIEPITHILSQSLSSGIVPEQMKIAKVVPIYKSSDQNTFKNYRSVSLLPAFSKLLEKIVFRQLMTFLTEHKIFYEHQYGFRPKHSTIHPIIHLLNHCASSSSKNDPEVTLAIPCDLSKAFDVIHNDILLNKLNNYGIRGLTNDWFRGYLSHREQFVDIEGMNSNRVQMTIAVPQGSILGPLMYLQYVNDINNSCDGTILSFADDTTLLTSHSDLSELHRNVNH